MTKKPDDKFKFSGLSDSQQKVARGMKFATPKTVFAADGEPQSKTRPGAEKFFSAFGSDRGGKWFAEGKTFSEAQTLYAAELQKELTALKAINHKQALALARLEK